MEKRKPGRPKGKPKTGGRRKGTPNKTTAALKDAIINAFTQVGGVDYLVMVAKDDPRTFCTLLGKVLPLQLTGGEGETDKPLTFTLKLDSEKE